MSLFNYWGWSDSDNVYGWGLIKPASRILFWAMVLVAPSLLGLLRRLLVAILLLLVVSIIPGLTLDILALAPASSAADTVILADPADTYYPLAEEMARSEGLSIAHTLDEAMERDPVYMLWVVSPGGLSDRAVVDLGLAMRDRPSAVSVGIFSGATLQEARALWLRAGEARGSRVVAANAANPSGHIEAAIYTSGDSGMSSLPLTRANLLGQLQQADYLTFTGHGGKSYLRLDEDTVLRPADLPSLPPVVVATGSCNTFRPWEENSIALAFTDQGAAGYTGFAYSPNEGYLIGEFDGLPFRYTWPDYPIGHVVQVQNRGTLQGFAQFAYYHLLGDPRIALQAEAPYQLVEDRESAGMRTLGFAAAPAGMIPVRIPGGARYSFVEIPGVSAAWEGDPFYNARLQMVDIQEDKYLLFAHPGGSFTLHLRTSPPWLWVAGDIVSDALDNTLLYVPQTGGDLMSLAVAGVALGAVAWLLLRKKATVRTLVPAALAGFGFAALHGLYALVRLDRLTITSKFVVFSPLALASTFLLVGCGAFLYLNARSWRGKAVALLVASVGALAPAVFTLGLLGVMNNILLKPRLGAGLWNYALGLQPVIALALEIILFAAVFFVLNRAVESGEKEQVKP